MVMVSSGAPYTATVSGTAIVSNSPTVPRPTSSGILGAGGTSRLPSIPRNAFQMPRIVNVDLRIAKKFNLYESWRFELVQSSSNSLLAQRQIQIGARLTF